MKYKKSRYQICQPIHSGVILCTSGLSNRHILLSSEIYTIYERGDIEKLEKSFPKIFQRLKEGQFIVEKDVDEKKKALLKIESNWEDKKMYQLIVNPTLDCNLSCWYCYENRVAKSSVDEETVRGIVKNIKSHFEVQPFTFLKLSFFGGEPFLKPLAIKTLVNEASLFCDSKSIKLLLDITTYAIVITKSLLEELRDHQCIFQITLDGNREQHNKIKFTENKSFEAYGATLKNIKRIQSAINNSFIAIRINFDEETLKGFDSILNDIDGLDRLKTKVILKKIWQVEDDKIDKQLVYDIISRLFKHNFVVDYNSQMGPCFADKKNEAVINFDGNVFKCTTISTFNEQTAFGHLDNSSGKIIWKEKQIESLNSQQVKKECLDCAYFPTCGGPCKMKCLAEKNWTCSWLKDPDGLKQQARTQFEIEYIKSKIIKSYTNA